MYFVRPPCSAILTILENQKKFSKRLVWSLGFRVWGLGFMVYSLWFMVYGLWFMVYGLGFRVEETMFEAEMRG